MAEAKRAERAVSRESGEGEHEPDLSPREREEVQQRKTPRTEVIYQTIREDGEHELQRAPATLAWDGLTAGLSMGFSLVAEGLLRAHLPAAHWRPAVAKFGYSVGFLIVVIGRQQLFTENTLTAILPLLQRRTADMLARVLRLWAVVLAANLAGALLFALVVGQTELFSPEVRAAFTELGRETVAGGWARTLLRGVFAGWLIALMVWMLPGAAAARFWVILAVTYVVAFGGFSHIVAGAIEVFYLVTAGGYGWSVFFGWMLPTLVGNIIGGTTLVAMLGHAQVASEARKV